VRLPGHPDHASDLVVEGIVDEYLRRDPATRIRLAAVGGRGVMFVSGDAASQADFDVSAVVKRTLGSLGVTDDVEPFISIEPVAPESLSAFRLHAATPVTVTGYATSETPEGIPVMLAVARRAAKRLEEKRRSDPEWFWLGPDADVTAFADSAKAVRLIVTMEHAGEPLESARRKVAEELQPVADGAVVVVNPAGASERRGLANASGASGRAPAPYGSMIPTHGSAAGSDPSSAEKAGAWLCRAAALRLMREGSRAVLVRATYLPGDMKPSIVVARDERGVGLSSRIPADELSIDRVLKEWWRPGLNTDACRWGFAGEPGLPWEG
jgi:S-adenosylmethionine synthetase